MLSACQTSSLIITEEVEGHNPRGNGPAMPSSAAATAICPYGNKPSECSMLTCLGASGRKPNTMRQGMHCSSGCRIPEGWWILWKEALHGLMLPGVAQANLALAALYMSADLATLAVPHDCCHGLCCSEVWLKEPAHAHATTIINKCFS